MPIPSNLKRLRLRQLDSVLKLWKQVQPYRKPPRGWILAIREALGMSLAQLGRRLGTDAAGAKRLQDREATGTISLASLRRVAEAMDCELVYALVPRTSLEDVIHRQAGAVAHEGVRRVAQTMSLEAQGVHADELREQERQLADQLVSERPRKLWEYPTTSGTRTPTHKDRE